MRASLPHSDARDGCTAVPAGFTGSPVDPEIILKIPAAVYPVDAGPVSLDAFL